MKSLLSVLLISINFLTSAQSVKFTSEESIQQKYPNGLNLDEDKSTTSFHDGNNTIVIECNVPKIGFFEYSGVYHNQKSRVTIHKYEANGDEISLIKPENGKQEFGPILPVTIEFNKKILLFYFKNSDNDALKLFVSELDKNDLSLLNTKEVCTYGQHNADVLPSKKGILIQQFLRLSADKMKLLLVVPVYKDELFTCVFSSDMSVLRKKVSQIEIKEYLMISEALVENTGNNIIVFKDFVMPGHSNGMFIPSFKAILLQKVNNSELLIDVKSLEEEHRLVDAHLGLSIHSSKTVLFGDYLEKNWGAGIWATDIETENLKINKPLLIPYPEDFAKRVYHVGFGDRNGDKYGLETVDYELVEFENGDLAVCGSPTNKGLNGEFFMNTGRGISLAASIYSGPIMVTFISSNKKQNVFTMIPRYISSSSGSKGIYVPYKNKLIVLYNDFEKNINGELIDDDVHQKKKGDLSLAYATILKDGTIEGRKILEEWSSKSEFYRTKNANIISDRKILIPSFHTEKKSNVIKVANITIE